MQFIAAQIAQLLQGTVEGDPNATVSKLSKIEEGGEGSLSFLANPAYTQYVYGTTASVVIGGAMGVRQDFYADFARWLAGQGFRVTTFDYRGHGDSLVGPMREVRADLFDWARDYEAVIAAARAA